MARNEGIDADDILRLIEDAVRQYVVSQSGTHAALPDLATSGHAQHLLKAGDTMTGPFIASRDPVSLLEVATKRYVDYSHAPLDRGLSWAYTSATVVTLNPGGEDGKGVVWLTDGSDWIPYEFSSAETWTIVPDGTTNRLTDGTNVDPTYTETTAGYYLIWLSDASGGSLVKVWSTDPDGATVAALFSKARWSRPLFFANNTHPNRAGTAIWPFFRGPGGRYYYTDSTSTVQMWRGGPMFDSLTAVTPTVANINLTHQIPSPLGSEFGYQITPRNNGATGRALTVYTESGGTINSHVFVRMSNATARIELVSQLPVFADPSAMVWYNWSGAVTDGAQITIGWWKMPWSQTN
jgi:hypothetical protein